MTATILQFRRMTTPREQLPNRIRELREARRMTQTDLAEAVATTYSTVGRFETGARELTMSWMRKFARALDVDVGQLLLPADNKSDITPGEWAMIRAMRHADPAAVDVLVGLAERTIDYDAGNRTPRSA